MALSRKEQQLIDVLRALPAYSVYTNAAKREILRGFKLHVDRQVVRIHWEDDGVLVVTLGTLTSSDDQPGLHSVRIFADEVDLRLECSCRGSNSSGRCAHAVAALITVFHLMNPKLFRMTAEDVVYRARLEAGLMKRPFSVPENARIGGARNLLDVRDNVAGRPHTPQFHVVIEPSGTGLRVFVESDGRRLGGPADFHSLPWDLAYLVRCSYQNDMSFALSNFLKRTANAYPLSYQKGLLRHKVEWLGERTFPTWTELDAQGGQVVLRKGFSMGNGGLNMSRLVGNFAFNDDRTQMCYLAAREGWQPWEHLRDLCANDSDAAVQSAEANGCEIRIPVDRFRALQLALKKSRAREVLGSIRCLEKGQEVQVRAVETTRYGLVISRAREGEGTFLIEPECRSGEYVFRPSQRIMSFVRDVEWGRLPASIRTKKRKPVLYNQLFQALGLGIRKGLTEWLGQTINEYSFGRRTFASEARSRIKHAIDKFREEELQFHLTDEGWRLISVDKEKEKHLFIVPYTVFGPVLFDRLVRHGTAMVVREEHLLERLHLLYEVASEAGIDLFLDEYPIESVTWEMELDARTGSIDWFEIRPEIRCNGRTIPRELWEQALARKGVIVRNGAIQILDRKSLDALAAFSRLWAGTKAATGPRSIVSIPRLRIIDLLSLRKQGIEVRLSTEDEAVMQRLTRFIGIEERPVPDGLVGSLRHYQKAGFEWLAFLYEHRFGACLADDMGLGKTVQAICLIAAIKEGKVRRAAGASSSSRQFPFLIVVPPSLIFNWEQEIARFYPDLKVHVYRGRERSTEVKGYDVMLTSYGLIRRDIGKLKGLTFNVIIFDEAQAIKNIFADTTGAVRQLKGLFKMALTGTPVENHVGEYFSIMDLVLPGLLGEYREFQGRARTDIATLLPDVAERTRPFMLRRTKERILKELPPKIERDVYLELTEQQKRFYNRTVEEVRSTIDAAYRGKTASRAKIIALTAIMKLRQICLSPQLLVADMKDPTPKIEFLKEKVEELFSESHSALVFSQFTSFLDVVEAELRTKGVSLLRLDGSTPVPKRKEIVEAFQGSAEPTVFLLSLKAGGQGLNLTRAAYVFHLDPWWNPAVESQASDRSHRIGQAHKVIVTRLLMRHTVEEKMMALKHRKLGLYRALMEAPDRSGTRAITREDFDFLLS
jgi:superfamily II DNA or RNA helicase